MALIAQNTGATNTPAPAQTMETSAAPAASSTPAAPTVPTADFSAMEEVVLMPRLSDTMTEGVIAGWHKQIGDLVKKGEVLADIETDKATMELESYKDGILLYQGAKAGEKILVNDLLCIIGQQGLEKGTGENGRITRTDLDNYTPGNTSSVARAAAPRNSNFVGQVSFVDTPVSQMRKTIARRLSESLFTAPHFYLTMKINMDATIAARTVVNETAPVKISFNDFIVKAVALSLKQHPKVNSSWLGDVIRENHHVNIGIAVAVDEGLLVPVLRFADGLSLDEISISVKEFAKKAKDKKLQPSDWEGSTFTISNLGMYGIDSFTAIINPPDACILAVGGIAQEPVVKNGQIVPGNVMNVTLSCDHRVVDGATGSAFLQTLKSYLEEPLRMFV